MKRNIKTIIGLIIVFIIGISTTVGAAAIFKSEDITYRSDKTDKTNVKDSLDELYSKVGKCPEGQLCVEPKISNAPIGSYISMTPTSKSYTPPSELTGCMNDENCTQKTINPSELNLWRVIRKNDDGTVDVVSEYVSSESVYIYGKTGYMNYIKALNTIAAQYTNENYVQSTRYMGYSNQIEKCTSLEACPSDMGYETDTFLVQSSIGFLHCRDVGGKASSYWLASRSIEDDLRVKGSIVGSDGVYHVTYSSLFTIGGKDGVNWCTVRPILTLKSDVQIKSGDGKSASTAYQLA